MTTMAITTRGEEEARCSIILKCNHSPIQKSSSVEKGLELIMILKLTKRMFL